MLTLSFPSKDLVTIFLRKWDKPSNAAISGSFGGLCYQAAGWLQATSRVKIVFTILALSFWVH